MHTETPKHRAQGEINTTSKLLGRTSKTVGLRVNENKIKYLTVIKGIPKTDYIAVD